MKLFRYLYCLVFDGSFKLKLAFLSKPCWQLSLFQGKFNVCVTWAAQKLAAQPLDCFEASFNTALELDWSFTPY